MAAQTIGVSSWQTTNEAANQSTVYVGMTLYSNGWSFDGYTTYYGLRIGDAWSTGVGVRTLYSPNTWYVEWSRTYNHDANGYRGAVDTEAYFDGTGPYMPDYLSAGGGTQGAVDYYRGPSAPTTVTPVLNADKSITVTSNAVSSPASTPTYYVAYSSSSNGGSSWSSWSGWTTIPANGRSYTYAMGSLTMGLTYRFKMYTSNSDGSSGETLTTTNTFLPAGAKMYDGSNWKNGTIANIYTDALGWRPITTAKRHNGTDWVNLT